MENNNQQPKRILIFSMSYYPRFVGGAEVALKEITDRLDEKEFEFHLVTLRYDSLLPKCEKIGNIHIHRIGFTKKNATFEDLRSFPLRLNKILYQFWAPCVGFWLHKKYAFTKVWSMMAHSAGIPGNIFSRISRVPLLLTLQEGDPVEHIGKQMRIFGPLFTGVFTQAKQIQTISQFLKEWAIKMKSKVIPQVVPNGVDTQVFVPGNGFNKKEGFRLITTSRLVPKNGVDLVIQAMAQLPENVYFDIVGDGYERSSLEGLVRKLNLEKKIFFYGQKNEADLVLLLQNADVFVRASRSEGFGNSFLEAMSIGLPVVATPVGGITDFLFDPNTHKDKATGLLCEIEDPKSIEQCVRRLMQDSTLRTTLSHNAQNVIPREYDWDLIVPQMEVILKK